MSNNSYRFYAGSIFYRIWSANIMNLKYIFGICFFFFVIEKYFNLINRNIIFPRFDKFSNRCYLNFVQFKPRYIFFFFINSFIRVRIIRYSRIFVTLIQLIIYIQYIRIYSTLNILGYSYSYISEHSKNVKMWKKSKIEIGIFPRTIPSTVKRYCIVSDRFSLKLWSRPRKAIN